MLFSAGFKNIYLIIALMESGTSFLSIEVTRWVLNASNEYINLNVAID
ncbi:hypothetical protein [Pedobacter paludis]|nr:hypothetical protein [Pedobacter paludis]